MKAKLLSAVLIAAAFTALGQTQPPLPDQAGIIYISPANANGEDPITITFVPALSCEAGTGASLVGAAAIHLHAGGMDDQYNWRFPHDWDASGNTDATQLTSNGDGSYSITITPRTYFPFDATVPVGQIKGFKCVFNSGNSTPSPWDRQAHARSSSGTACTTDLVVYFPVPASLVSVKDPQRASLGAAVIPNPVSGKAQIRYSLRVAGNVKISIKDVLGATVAVLHEGFMPSGVHKTTWDATITPGLYVCTVETEYGSEAVRVLVR